MKMRCEVCVKTGLIVGAEIGWSWRSVSEGTERWRTDFKDKGQFAFFLSSGKEQDSFTDHARFHISHHRP